MQHDLIIIGSGSVDAAAGYYARRAGLSVLMTDTCRPPHQEGSHHGSGRFIRHTYDEGEKYVPLALHVQQLWDELAGISDEAAFKHTGAINLGPADPPFLANITAGTRAFDLEVEGLDAQAVTQRWPEIRLLDNYWAIFGLTSGVLCGELAVETQIRPAQEAGCAQLFNCPASAIHHHANGVTIDTLDGEYHDKKLLISVGTWVIRLLPNLPTQPARKVSAWFQTDGRYSNRDHFPAFTGELPNGGQYYGFPAEDDELKIGKHNGGQPISTPQERSAFGAAANGSSESLPLLRNVLPGIDGYPHGASYTYDNTASEDLIIDTLPGRPDTLLTTGLSDHDFKFAPVLGEVASQFAQGQTSTFNLAPFSSARFSS